MVEINGKHTSKKGVKINVHCYKTYKVRQSQRKNSRDEKKKGRKEGLDTLHRSRNLAK